MRILHREDWRVESPIPRVMRKNIKKLKKFPWLTKAILIRVYRDDETDRKLYKFVFSDDYRQDFIRYFNDLYQQERDNYERRRVSFLGKVVKETREEENKKEIQEKAEKALKGFDETTK